MSNSELGPFTIQAEPKVSNNQSVGSVVFEINGNRTVVMEAPFTLTGEGGESMVFAAANLPEGNFTITVTAYSGPDGTGTELDTATATIQTTGESAATTGAAANPNSPDKSEFNVVGEAEAEAETEVETEVAENLAGGASANSAAASAFGSNAVAQTLASGSISLDLAGADERILQTPTESEGPSGESGRPVGGDGPISGGDTQVGATIISADAEAEAEIEAETEVEVSVGVASASAGIGAAVAAVGTDAFLSNAGSAGVVASETATSISGASSTSTDVSDVSDGVVVTETPDPADEGTPDAAGGTPPGETNSGPATSALQADEVDGAAIQTDTESEVEVESEAEAEVEVAEGTAAAAATGASAVAAAGNFAAVDTETSLGTSTSTDVVTVTTPDLFAVAGATPGELTIATGKAEVIDGQAIIFETGQKVTLMAPVHPHRPSQRATTCLRSSPAPACLRQRQRQKPKLR